jgi:hypothetical protein
MHSRIDSHVILSQQAKEDGEDFRRQYPGLIAVVGRGTVAQAAAAAMIFMVLSRKLLPLHD